MKKLYVLAVLLMVTTTAHAGNSISFEIEGHKIHIETPKDCDSLSCIKVSAPGLSGFGFKKSARGQDDDAAPAPKAAAAPVDQTPAPQPTVAAVGNAASETVGSAPPAPVIKDTVAAPPVTPAPKPALVATTSAAAPATPLGVWATEENKGSVRIEQCGENLCGVAATTGEKILINMKPSESKWTGRIHDPDSGRTYDSSMTMKGPNTLRIQGCAFSGLFCGGQTWTRIS